MHLRELINHIQSRSQNMIDDLYDTIISPSTRIEIDHTKNIITEEVFHEVEVVYESLRHIITPSSITENVLHFAKQSSESFRHEGAIELENAIYEARLTQIQLIGEDHHDL